MFVTFNSLEKMFTIVLIGEINLDVAKRAGPPEFYSIYFPEIKPISLEDLRNHKSYDKLIKKQSKDLKELKKKNLKKVWANLNTQIELGMIFIRYFLLSCFHQLQGESQKKDKNFKRSIKKG